MFKNLFFALSLTLAVSNVNVDTIDTNTYKYGLPYEINTNIDLSYTSANVNSNISDLYSPKELWTNKELNVPQFIDWIKQFHTGEINIDDYNDIYQSIVGDSSFNLWDISPNLYNNFYVVIEGYVDMRGNYISLSNDNYYVCNSLSYSRIDDNTIMPVIKTNTNNLYNIEISSDFTTHEAVLNTEYTLDYIYNNSTNIYIKGFLWGLRASYHTYYIPKTALNFITQLFLNFMWEDYIWLSLQNNVINWFSDFNYSITNESFTFYNFKPYYYLGFNNYDQLYQIYNGSLSYPMHEFPAIVCLYNGWFDIGGVSFNNIYATYMIENSDYIYSINGISFTLQDTAKLLIFDRVIAYNEFTGAYKTLVYNNYWENTTQEWEYVYMTMSTNNYVYYGDTLNLHNYYSRYDSTLGSYSDYNNSTTTWHQYDPGFLPLYDMKYVDGNEIFNQYRLDFNNLKNNVCETYRFNNYYDNLFKEIGDIPTPPPTPTPTPNVNVLVAVFDLFSLAFTAIGGFLNIQVFPNVSIGLLLMIPFVVMLIILIVKLFKR